MKRPLRPTFRLALVIAGFAATTACGPQIIGNPMPDDLDGDGYPAETDCDDSDAEVHPDAAEVCDDDLDNNCDGLVDEEDEACLLDADGDGYPQAKDCDDDNAAVHPEALEVCDGVDNDCNGSVDDTADRQLCLSTDMDGDGYPTDEDCDDGDAAIHPDAIEHCDDGLDNDCDGELDWADVECSVIGNG